MDEPEFGENVIQIQGKIPADQAQEVGPALDDAFGLEGGEQGIQTTSVGPDVRRADRPQRGRSR